MAISPEQYLEKTSLHNFPAYEVQQTILELTSGPRKPTKSELLKYIITNQIASQSLASRVIQKANCLSHCPYSNTVSFDEQTKHELNNSIIPTKCGKCEFGLELKGRTGCSMLRESLAFAAHDIRKTRHYSPNRLTHYSLDTREKAANLALQLLPEIENAVLTLINNHSENLNDNFWSLNLAKSLYPRFAKAHPQLDEYFQKIGKNNLHPFEIFEHIGGDLTIKNNELNEFNFSPEWAAMIREGGIFHGIGFCISKCFPIIRDSPHEQLQNPNFVRRVTLDHFFTDESESNIFVNNYYLSGSVTCPGQSVALTTCHCLMFNKSLYEQNLFHPSQQRFIPLTLDGQPIRIKEMSNKYSSILTTK